MDRVINTVYQGLKAAMQAILANSMRSVLTTLGIIIGVTAVIAVVAIMNGLDPDEEDEEDAYVRIHYC